LTILATTPNDGSENWTIPDAVSTESRVRISDAADGNIFDVSDAVFAISAAPSLTLTAPNGGENWIAGSAQSITWNSSGAIANVKLEYSITNGANWLTILATTPNDGSENWTIPDAASTESRVRVSDAVDGNIFDFSDAVFVIVTVPSAPALASPQNSAIIGADTVQFVWRQSVPAADQYWFELATDSLMANVVIDSTLADTTKIVRRLRHNQTYWWRVRAKNAAGFGSFSERRQFHILLTSIYAREEIPREFYLNQNYPNPFWSGAAAAVRSGGNSSTTIAYALPRSAHVDLRVYDVLGNEVKILVNQEQQAGVYRVRFDGTNLPGGVYFYRLRAGENVAVKKLTIIK
jgi:hypothetical protein